MTLAYHFVGETLRDGRPVPPDGEWLVHNGPVEMCRSGLHASLHPLDALKYAPGETLCLVEVEDIVATDADKLVCRRRKIIKRIDATALLRGFVRWQAYQVLHLWIAPEIVRKFIETGDENLRDTALDAAWDTALDAAWDTALDAAWDTALDAAWDTALDAARAAARAAAWAAAWDAASDDFALLVDMAMENAT